jgi:hypothetical protein
MKRIALSIGLVALCAFLAALATAAVNNPVYQGEFPNGARLIWQCQPGATGTVKLAFVQPDGQSYEAEVRCGVSV